MRRGKIETMVLCVSLETQRISVLKRQKEEKGLAVLQGQIPFLSVGGGRVGDQSKKKKKRQVSLNY